MEPDLGLIIGLIGVIGAVGVLGLSYLGAYFVGYNRARNELERQRREEEREDSREGHADRILMVEGALASVAEAMERLTDAQRVMLLEQARGASSPERRLDAVRLKQHNTPA
jgi:hypothetical protein